MATASPNSQFELHFNEARNIIQRHTMAIAIMQSGNDTYPNIPEDARTEEQKQKYWADVAAAYHGQLFFHVIQDIPPQPWTRESLNKILGTNKCLTYWTYMNLRTFLERKNKDIRPSRKKCAAVAYFAAGETEKAISICESDEKDYDFSHEVPDIPCLQADQLLLLEKGEYDMRMIKNAYVLWDAFGGLNCVVKLPDTGYS